MGATTPWWVPVAVGVLAAAGVLVASVLTAYAAARRERDARRAEHESERLVQLVDAALDLREAIRDSLDSPTKTHEAEARLERAGATFVARREAVLTDRARDAAGKWWAVATAHFATGAARQAESETWDVFLVEAGTARRRAV